MAEYIEREAIIAHLQECVGTPPEIAYTFPIYKAIERFVKGLPTADVAPVVRSEWEILTDDSGNEYMRCKQCGEEFYDGDNDTVDTKHNFCPNCGADMREG